MHLAAIETRANQRYIFSSNKQAEAAGASELINLATTEWLSFALSEALAARGHPVIDLLDNNGQPLAEQRPVEDGAPLEVLLASSGVALLLSSEVNLLRDVVAGVTGRALVQAPGLGVSGAITGVSHSGRRAFASATTSASSGASP